MRQIRQAEKIAVAKYPREDGWILVWLFDHSSCHAAMPDDALDVNKMNVNPGGKQLVMRDGWWGGKSQKMTYNLGIPKGMRVVLEERGVNTHKMTADKMREILRSHPDVATKSPALNGSWVKRNGTLCTCILPSKGCGLKRRDTAKHTVNTN